MEAIDLFSKRQEKLTDENSDVYEYEILPDKFRNQCIHILRKYLVHPRYDLFKVIYDKMCEEHGFEDLPIKTGINRFDRLNLFNYQQAIFDFIKNYEEKNLILDIIELSCPLIREEQLKTVQELNIRFKENKLGYQIEEQNLKIIKRNSEYSYEKIQKPVFKLLSVEYKGANDEFIKAHEFYLKADYKSCLSECCKAFESAMKTICDKHNWFYEPQKATAQKLVKACFDNNLIPTYMKNHFNSLESLLTSVSTPRNKTSSAHGQGSYVITVDEHLAEYALNLTATNILFLVKCEKQIT